MVLFDGFRQGDENTYYNGRKSAALVDVRLVLILALCAVIAVALILVALGTKGGKERWSNTFRTLYSLYVGTAIIVGIFSSEWQTADIKTSYMLTETSQEERVSYLGVRIGLKSLNITLDPHSDTDEHTHYNEIFSFDGVYDMEDAYKANRKKGIPNPILYIAEYFTVDVGGLRWKRSVREAGHFVHILLWTAFVAWAASVILLLFVIFHGAILLMLSGFLMASSCCIYHFLQPKHALVIPFQDDFMRFQYGWSFWLALVSGLLTFFISLLVLVLYYIFPAQMASILLLEPNYLAVLADDENQKPETDSTSKPLQLDEPTRFYYDNNGFQDDIQKSLTIGPEFRKNDRRTARSSSEPNVRMAGCNIDFMLGYSKPLSSNNSLSAFPEEDESDEDVTPSSASKEAATSGPTERQIHSEDAGDRLSIRRSQEICIENKPERFPRRVEDILENQTSVKNSSEQQTVTRPVPSAQKNHDFYYDQTEPMDNVLSDPEDYSSSSPILNRKPDVNVHDVVVHLNEQEAMSVL